MTNIVKRRTSCSLCDSTSLDLALQLRPTPIADAIIKKPDASDPQPTFPLDLYLCSSCGHLQLLDVLDPSMLFQNYEYVTSSSLGLPQHFKNYASWILEWSKGSANGLVVEIGSNDGSLLKAFKELGFKVLGVDPAQRIAATATAEGIETIPTFFSSAIANQILQSHGSASVVCANNVFAHSDQLIDMVVGIHALLRENGLFVFEVSYLVDTVERMIFDTIYHEHLSYHAVKPLATLFANHDMELVDVVRIPTKGGSIRCIAQRKNGPFLKSATVAALVKAEEDLGYFSLDIYKEYQKKIDTKKRELQNVLESVRAQGGHVAGYGMSQTVTTLMYHFELGGLEFLVDDNPAKQGKFSPGYHLPILSPEDMLKRMPSHIVILAWNYVEPIVNKNRAYLEKGGKFIVPLPEVRIIEN
jgi:SAM-dependent methyltransferase